MNYKYILSFVFGFFSCAFFILGYFNLESEIPFGTAFSVVELNAPSDFVDTEDIIIFDDIVVLKISNASLSSYSPTGSMKPLFDEGANGIRVVPRNENSIREGDIVTFERNKILIVHRVIEVGKDEYGVYYVTKGDNNLKSDEKIRFEDIKYKTVGVIW